MNDKEWDELIDLYQSLKAKKKKIRKTETIMIQIKKELCDLENNTVANLKNIYNAKSKMGTLLRIVYTRSSNFKRAVEEYNKNQEEEDKKIVFSNEKSYSAKKDKADWFEEELKCCSELLLDDPKKLKKARERIMSLIKALPGVEHLTLEQIYKMSSLSPILQFKYANFVIFSSDVYNYNNKSGKYSKDPIKFYSKVISKEKKETQEKNDLQSNQIKIGKDKADKGRINNSQSQIEQNKIILKEEHEEIKPSNQEPEQLKRGQIMSQIRKLPGVKNLTLRRIYNNSDLSKTIKQKYNTYAQFTSAVYLHNSRGAPADKIEYRKLAYIAEEVIEPVNNIDKQLEVQAKEQINNQFMEKLERCNKLWVDNPKQLTTALLMSLIKALPDIEDLTARDIYGHSALSYIIKNKYNIFKFFTRALYRYNNWHKGSENEIKYKKQLHKAKKKAIQAVASIDELQDEIDRSERCKKEEGQSQAVWLPEFNPLPLLKREVTFSLFKDEESINTKKNSEEGIGFDNYNDQEIKDLTNSIKQDPYFMEDDLGAASPGNISCNSSLSKIFQDEDDERLSLNSEEFAAFNGYKKQKNAQGEKSNVSFIFNVEKEDIDIKREPFENRSFDKDIETNNVENAEKEDMDIKREPSENRLFDKDIETNEVENAEKEDMDIEEFPENGPLDKKVETNKFKIGRSMSFFGHNSLNQKSPYTEILNTKEDKIVSSGIYKKIPYDTKKLECRKIGFLALKEALKANGNENKVELLETGSKITIDPSYLKTAIDYLISKVNWPRPKIKILLLSVFSKGLRPVASITDFQVVLSKEQEGLLIEAIRETNKIMKEGKLTFALKQSLRQTFPEERKSPYYRVLIKYFMVKKLIEANEGDIESIKDVLALSAQSWQTRAEKLVKKVTGLRIITQCTEKAFLDKKSSSEKFNALKYNIKNIECRKIGFLALKEALEEADEEHNVKILDNEFAGMVAPRYVTIAKHKLIEKGITWSADNIKNLLQSVIKQGLAPVVSRTDFQVILSNEQNALLREAIFESNEIMLEGQLTEQLKKRLHEDFPREASTAYYWLLIQDAMHKKLTGINNDQTKEIQVLLGYSTQFWKIRVLNLASQENLKVITVCSEKNLLPQKTTLNSSLDCFSVEPPPLTKKTQMESVGGKKGSSKELNQLAAVPAFKK